MSIRTIAAIAAASITLVACGGGGGGGSSTAPVTPPTPATPAPTVTMTISQPKITLGASATITWSSTNATSCTASDGWSGTQAISGTSAQTPIASGSLTYTLICTGAGGSAKQSVSLIVPIPVLKSSYENKITAGQKLGPQSLPAEVPSSNSVAFADFFQDGSYSMVTHTLEYIDAGWSKTAYGHIKFYKRDAAGAWIDNTTALIKDNAGCLHPRKAVVADFNGDGKPDVFFACHGYDKDPWPGEQPHVLLSQQDGTYTNVTLPVTCFCHSASAVDFKGTGYADIVVTNNLAPSAPFFFRNTKGSFTVDTASLPSTLTNKALFSTEFIDFNGDGKYDLWIAGNEPGSTDSGDAGTMASQIILNDGSDGFLKSKTYDLPTVPDYGLPLDIVYQGGKVYLLRTNIGGGPENYGKSFYTTAAIQSIDFATLKSSMVYTHSGAYANGMQWVNWLIPYNGAVVAMDKAYTISVN